MRLNPARDQLRAWAHDAALALASLAHDRGVVVLNNPDGLVRAGHKLYLSHLPAEVRPRTLVTRDAEQVRMFIQGEGGPCVVKPLTGTRGRDVFLVTPDNLSNFHQIVDVLVRRGYAMVQSFVPGAEHGDVRLVLMDGELLEVDGQVAAVRRVPGENDFRSNVHVGGKPSAVTVTDELRSVAHLVGPVLAADGLFLVGLDVIGGKVIEVNAHSTGGLGDAEQYYSVSFTGAVIDAIETRAAAAMPDRESMQGRR